MWLRANCDKTLHKKSVREICSSLIRVPCFLKYWLIPLELSQSKFVAGALDGLRGRTFGALKLTHGFMYIFTILQLHQQCRCKTQPDCLPFKNSKLQNYPHSPQTVSGENTVTSNWQSKPLSSQATTSAEDFVLQALHHLDSTFCARKFTLITNLRYHKQIYQTLAALCNCTRNQLSCIRLLCSSKSSWVTEPLIKLRRRKYQELPAQACHPFTFPHACCNSYSK